MHFVSQNQTQHEPGWHYCTEGSASSRYLSTNTNKTVKQERWVVNTCNFNRCLGSLASATTRKALHLHNSLPPHPQASRGSSGKDCQVVWNPKLLCRGLWPTSAILSAGCNLLPPLCQSLHVQRRRLHQQPPEQRFLLLQQQVNNDLQPSVKSVLVQEVIGHTCMIQLSSAGDFHLLWSSC